MGKKQDALKRIKVVQRVVANKRRSNQKVSAPQPDYGASAASGHMPDPDVDNDVDEMAGEVGLYTEATEEEPHEVDVAEEVRESEEARRGRS